MAGKLKLLERPLTLDDEDSVVLEVFVYSSLNHVTWLLAREYDMEFCSRENFKLLTYLLTYSMEQSPS